MSDASLKHYLQGEAWAAFKARRGWKAHTLDLHEFGLGDLRLFSRLANGAGHIFYIPKSPNILKAEIIAKLKTSFPKAVAFEVEVEDDFKLEPQPGLVQADRVIQYRSTLKIDLTKTPEAIKSGMGKSTRNEINRAKKAGVIAREAKPDEAAFEQMHELMREVHGRVGHFVRPKAYLFDLWREFAKHQAVRVFFAEANGEVVAGALLFTEGKRAWYKEGGSKRGGDAQFAPSFLQWEIIRALKRDNFKEYDLGGVAANLVTDADDPMKNVYAFKRRLSGDLHVSPGMVDIVNQPAAYRVWRKLEPYYLKGYHLLTKDFWY